MPDECRNHVVRLKYGYGTCFLSFCDFCKLKFIVSKSVFRDLKTNECVKSSNLYFEKLCGAGLRLVTSVRYACSQTRIIPCNIRYIRHTWYIPKYGTHRILMVCQSYTCHCNWLPQLHQNKTQTPFHHHCNFFLYKIEIVLGSVTACFESFYQQWELPLNPRLMGSLDYKVDEFVGQLNFFRTILRVPLSAG